MKGFFEDCADSWRFFDILQGILRIIKIDDDRLTDLFLQRNDIAVIELEAPLEFNDKVHAICLPPPQDPQGSIPQDSGNAVVAGWGFTQVYGFYLLTLDFVNELI